MTTTTAARLRPIVARHLGIDPATICPDSAFQEDLGADSLDTVELAMEVEDELNIRLSDDEVHDAIGADGTFGKLVELVDGKLASKREAA